MEQLINVLYLIVHIVGQDDGGHERSAKTAQNSNDQFSSRGGFPNVFTRVKHFMAGQGTDNHKDHLNNDDRHDQPNKDGGLEIVVRGQEVALGHVVEAGVNEVGERDVLADVEVEGTGPEKRPQTEVAHVQETVETVGQTVDSGGQLFAIFSEPILIRQVLVIKVVPAVWLLDGLYNFFEYVA